MTMLEECPHERRIIWPKRPRGSQEIRRRQEKRVVNHVECRDFPGGPGVKTPPSKWRGCESDPWSENHMAHTTPK